MTKEYTIRKGEAVNCKTEREAEILLGYLDEAGVLRKKHTYDMHPGNTCWAAYKVRMCYAMTSQRKAEYGALEHYLGHTILALDEWKQQQGIGKKQPKPEPVASTMAQKSLQAVLDVLQLNVKASTITISKSTAARKESRAQIKKITAAMKELK